MRTISVPKITKTVIDREGKERGSDTVTIRDASCGGLALVIGPRTMRWSYSYRPRGVNSSGKRLGARQITIGNTGSHNPDEARREALRLKTEVAVGGDPYEDRQVAIRARSTPKVSQRTCRDLLETWRSALTGSAQYQNDELVSCRTALEDMGRLDQPPAAVSVNDVKMMMARYYDRRSTQDKRRGALSRFFDYLVDAEVLSVNIVKSVSKKSRAKNISRRIVYLSAAQIQRLWEVAGAPHTDETYGDYLRVMTVLPLRRKMLAALSVSSVDAEARELVFEGLETKNGDWYTVPIPEIAWEIINRRLSTRRVKYTGLVFPSKTLHTSFYPSSKLINKLRSQLGFDFHHHDLRRTFQSVMGTFRLSDKAVLNAIINHRESQTRTRIDDHYFFPAWQAEKKRAMDDWAELVTGAVKSGNWVQPQRSAAR